MVRHILTLGETGTAGYMLDNSIFVDKEGERVRICQLIEIVFCTCNDVQIERMRFEKLFYRSRIIIGESQERNTPSIFLLNDVEVRHFSHTRQTGGIPKIQNKRLSDQGLRTDI